MRIRARLASVGFSVLFASMALSTASAQAPNAEAPATPPTSTATASQRGTPTTFVVKFRAKPGKNAELEKVFREMQAGVRDKEPGNVYYDFLVDSKDPQVYIIVERYKDEAGIKAHGQSEHAKKMIAALKDLTDGPPQAERFILISAK
jgi:quinol monooxygenase YgiN